MRGSAGQGFSLIELMIVVAIVAVLASVAIPRYQVYVQRSYVNASLAHSRPLQLALAEYLSINAEFPPDHEALSSYQVPTGHAEKSSSPASDLVEKINYSGSPEPAITIYYRDSSSVPAPLRGKHLVLSLLLDRNGLLDTQVGERSTLAKHLRPRL